MRVLPAHTDVECGMQNVPAALINKANFQFQGFRSACDNSNGQIEGLQTQEGCSAERLAQQQRGFRAWRETHNSRLARNLVLIAEGRRERIEAALQSDPG